MQLILPLDDNFSDQLTILRSESNREVIRVIEAWPQQLNTINHIILKGEAKSGKSIIAQFWADKNNAMFITNINKFLQNIDFYLQKYQNFVLEDVDAQLFSEHQVLYIINSLVDKFLLVTLTNDEFYQHINLADLTSRLRAMMTINIEPIDKALTTQLIAKLFSTRQMNVDNMIIEYLANLDFNYQQIFQLVEELNVFSKMAKKKITMPLIKKLVSNK